MALFQKCWTCNLVYHKVQFWDRFCFWPIWMDYSGLRTIILTSKCLRMTPLSTLWSTPRKIPQLQSKASYPVEEWCLKHNMKLDIAKSSLGHMTSNRRPLYFSYTVRNSTLTKVKVFRRNTICQFDLAQKCRVRKKKIPKTIVVLA